MDASRALSVPYLQRLCLAVLSHCHLIRRKSPLTRPCNAHNTSTYFLVRPFPCSDAANSLAIETVQRTMDVQSVKVRTLCIQWASFQISTHNRLLLRTKTICTHLPRIPVLIILVLLTGASGTAFHACCF